MKATWLARLARLERAQGGGDWRQGRGLSSLLKFVVQAEPSTDGDAPDEEPLDLEDTPMGRLLAEARRWQAQKGER